MLMRAAKVLSYLYHPVFIPLYALYIIFNSDSYLANNLQYEHKKIFFIFVAVLTVIMPSLSTFILVRNKMVSSMELPSRKERNGPYFITIFYYFLLYYLLRKIDNIPGPMLSMLIGAILTLVFVLILNSRIKISAHAAGVAGLVGIYFGLSSITVIIPDIVIMCSLIILFGLVATSRLLLEAHKPSEVYLGGIIGFLCEYVVIRGQYYF